MPNGPRKTKYSTISIPATVRKELDDRFRASPCATREQFARALLASYDTLATDPTLEAEGESEGAPPTPDRTVPIARTNRHRSA